MGVMALVPCSSFMRGVEGAGCGVAFCGNAGRKAAEEGGRFGENALTASTAASLPISSAPVGELVAAAAAAAPSEFLV